MVLIFFFFLKKRYERMKEATVSSIKAMGYNTSQTDEISEDDYLEKRRLLV